MLGTESYSKCILINRKNIKKYDIWFKKKASGKFSIYFVKCWLCNCLRRFLSFFFFRSGWYQPFKDKTEKPHFEYIRSSKKVKNLRNSYIFCFSILVEITLSCVALNESRFLISLRNSSRLTVSKTIGKFRKEFLIDTIIGKFFQERSYKRKINLNENGIILFFSLLNQFISVRGVQEIFISYTEVNNTISK